MTHPRSRAAAVAAPRPTSQARLALLTGGVMLASMALSGIGLSMARADEAADRRERQYKIGAAVLGAGALYYGLKKKNPIGTVVTGAGAYYAYKKSQENKQKSQRGRFGNRNPLPGRDGGIYDGPYDGSYDDGVYPDDDGYNYDNNFPDREPRRGRGGRNGRGGFPQDVLGDDYGTIGDYARGDDYAQGDYPDYGLNGLRARRGASNKAPQNGQKNRRIVVK